MQADEAQRLREIEVSLESIDVYFNADAGVYQRMEGAEKAANVDFSREEVSRQVGVSIHNLRRYEQHVRRSAGAAHA